MSCTQCQLKKRTQSQRLKENWAELMRQASKQRHKVAIIISKFTQLHGWFNKHVQEPMSRSMQLHYISVTAFL